MARAKGFGLPSKTIMDEYVMICSGMIYNTCNLLIERDGETIFSADCKESDKVWGSFMWMCCYAGLASDKNMNKPIW